MLFSTYAYLTNPQLKWAFQHLGFPDHFRIEPAIAKFLAAMALWFPVRLLKEVSYIGLAISFVSAIIAHIVVGDNAFHTICTNGCFGNTGCVIRGVSKAVKHKIVSNIKSGVVSCKPG